MVRTVKNRREEEEEDDEEFDSRTIDGSSHKVRVDGKTADQKTNSLRSKHSETEQRRRSKINERFQMLRDIIPQNDQKRDKASFLLEVIQYIQFLQEKLNMYEGSYQGWSQEPSKLMPWDSECMDSHFAFPREFRNYSSDCKQRNSRGPVENFLDQSQLMKNGFGNEDNIVITPAMLTDAQNSVESDLSAAALYKATDNTPVAATQTIPANMPLQPNVILDMPTQPCQGSISDAEHLASQSQAQFWQGRPCTTESAVPSYTLNDQEELKLESGEVSISNTYSQGLLNTLTHALQSSGVDLSQASISVQLDIGKRANSGHIATMSNAKHGDNLSPDDQAMAHYAVGSSGEDSDKAHKRLRTEQS